MPLWAKVIDDRKCIGCHACTVACKAEHLVPLGVTRTYVKQVDVGIYPNVRRHFQVTRCNQCQNPPCVEICPVSAMFQRSDGIVDFDRDVCIGCKSCMAACPYDAIYVSPETHSAEKCNFCAHRIDQGLEPACVAVCPERAIVVGDMLDSASEVSSLIAREKVDVRKPEKGTQPKVHYIEAGQFTLVPAAAAVPEIHAYAEQREGYPLRFERHDPAPDAPGGSDAWQEAAATGLPALGEGNAASAILAYDFPHKTPWDWRVSAYTWTKSIAAGAFLMSVLASLFDPAAPAAWHLGASLVAGFFLAATGVILIFDLEHPERFLNIMLRPQMRSWLARGAMIINGYALVLVLDVLARLLGWSGVPQALSLPGAALAILAAIYTAFLFSQAKGRDLWQNPLLPLHLLVQAVMAGSAALLLMGTVIPGSAGTAPFLVKTLAANLVLHLLLVASEAVMPHPTKDAGRAAHQMIKGAYRPFYWFAVVTAIAAVPLALAGLIFPAATLTLAGLAAYEHAYVQAGQSIPLS